MAATNHDPSTKRLNLILFVLAIVNFLHCCTFIQLFSLLLARGEELQQWMMLPLDLTTLLEIYLDYELEIFFLFYYAHLYYSIQYL
jgi:hypothetical protein